MTPGERDLINFAAAPIGAARWSQGSHQDVGKGEVAVPSSMIFVGLVVLWLLILVPAVARRRQEVARPSATALAGRVLERSPCRAPEPVRSQAAGRDLEVDVRQELKPARTAATRTEEDDRPGVPAPRREADPRHRDGASGREDSIPAPREHSGGTARPPGATRGDGGPPRYRPGRGGYDPQAAALTARARYATRQRVVLTLLVLAVGTAVAAALGRPLLWWAHGGVDLLLVGYLVYLRRQVRVEESIRRRRAARAGSSRVVGEAADGDDREAVDPDERPVVRPASGRVDRSSGLDSSSPERSESVAADRGQSRPEPAPVEEVGSAEPAVGPTPVKAEPPASMEPIEGQSALPRRKPLPLPPVPIGTTMVDTTEDDPSLHELECLARPDYRRASGQ